MFPLLLLAEGQSSTDSETKPSDIEQWKELNLTIRHWETLLFDNSKSFFTAVTFALGAAGAVVAWSTVGVNTQRVVLTALLSAAIVICLGAIAIIFSTQNYLGRYYAKRRQLEERFELTRAKATRKAGLTIPALYLCFALAIILCTSFLVVTWSYQPERSVLSGARLQGADLSMVNGLTQADLTNACGDATTKLPVNLVLPHCQP